MSESHLMYYDYPNGYPYENGKQATDDHGAVSLLVST